MQRVLLHSLMPKPDRALLDISNLTDAVRNCATDARHSLCGLHKDIIKGSEKLTRPDGL